MAVGVGSFSDPLEMQVGGLGAGAVAAHLVVPGQHPSEQQACAAQHLWRAAPLARRATHTHTPVPHA
jgi:hypothetical protein